MPQIKNLLKTVLPFLLGCGILWWMYRDTDWGQMRRSLTEEMNWGWMLFSLLFGIAAQALRAARWKQALAPLGEQPRLRTCVDAVFLSYASSLVIPRIGEVTRCGTLKRMDGTSFSKALGTVVTERLVDALLMLLLTAAAFASQLPTLLRFLRTTDMGVHDVLGRFTGTGYLVTLLCGVAVVLLAVFLTWRYAAFRKGRDILRGVRDGILSLRGVRNLPLYVVYSLAIWLSYYLHFYVAFFSFDYTAGFSPTAVFLIFCIGTYAVLVPTPNGAGPWHFAVKTMLVIYGVAEMPAILFALVVHTIQTGLVVLLGAYAWADLARMKRLPTNS